MLDERRVRAAVSPRRLLPEHGRSDSTMPPCPRIQAKSGAFPRRSNGTTLNRDSKPSLARLAPERRDAADPGQEQTERGPSFRHTGGRVGICDDHRTVAGLPARRDVGVLWTAARVIRHVHLL